MFTGIITDIGVVRDISGDSQRRVVITTTYATDHIALGASIACAGACLTVVDKGSDKGSGDWFAVDVSQETLNRTTLGNWQQGTRVNLERALCAGDELGGHFVTGHIDGIAHIRNIENAGDCKVLTIEVPETLKGCIAGKGSVALDGVSLTVNTVSDNTFTVNLIPHTLQHTTFQDRKPGDTLNLEVDLIARYLQRLLQTMPMKS